jgi:hypothetical protein
MVVGEHEFLLELVVIVVLLLLFSLDVSIPTSAHPLLFLDKWFGQIYLNAWGGYYLLFRGNT